MMKPIRNILLSGIILMMSSCQFSEDCNYTGKVDLTMDWESLWGDIQKPESLNVLFYRADRPSAQRVLLGDTIYENIPSGETEMVIINQPAGAECSVLESFTNSEIYLPTYFEGNIRTVNECPMICAFNNHFTVPIEGTVQQTVTPIPIIKQIFFVVHVVREGKTGNIASCRASLSGIPTTYSLSRQEALRNKATVFFPLEKHETDDEDEGDEFRHHFYVLGTNPSTAGQETIPKKLTITVLLDDGEVKSDEVDLSAELDAFDTNIFKCEVTVTITAASTNVEISSWEQGIWGQITIQ